MKTNFTRYFGSNIGRKIYIASLALIAIGVVIGYGYWWGYGFPFIIVGAAGFFISYGIQVSDKDVDEHSNVTIEEFKKRIDGRQLDKDILDVRNFSVFYGFLREDGETRFKSGQDGKLRTSKYFITAISADSKSFTAFTAYYDLFSDETPNDILITTKGADSTEFSREIIDFPSKNRRCTLKVTKNGSTEEFTFYVPDDALADKLVSRL